MESAMKEEKERENKKNIQYKKGWLCLVLFVVSLLGGIIMAWWVIQFHASNKNLWMVPFSLVLMITPIFVFISFFCTSMDSNSSSVSSLGFDQSTDITR